MKRRSYSSSAACSLPLLLPAVIASVVLVGCASRPSRADLAVEYYNIATAYFELEDWDNASRYYRRALGYDPARRRASFNLARAEIERGAYSEAITLLEDLKAEDPDNHLIVQLIGYAQYRAGELEQARITFERLKAEAPYEDRVVQNLAMVYAAEGTLESAAVLLGDTAERAGNPEPLLLQAAGLEYQRGDLETARRRGELLLREAEDLAEAAQSLGAVAYEYEDFEGAVRWYSVALDEAPDDLDLRFKRAAALLLSGNHEAGQQALQDTIEAGYADRDRIAELVEHEELEEREDLREFLKDLGVCFFGI